MTCESIAKEKIISKGESTDQVSLFKTNMFMLEHWNHIFSYFLGRSNGAVQRQARFKVNNIERTDVIRRVHSKQTHSIPHIFVTILRESDCCCTIRNVHLNRLSPSCLESCQESFKLTCLMVIVLSFIFISTWIVSEDPNNLEISCFQFINDLIHLFNGFNSDSAHSTVNFQVNFDVFTQIQLFDFPHPFRLENS